MIASRKMLATCTARCGSTTRILFAVHIPIFLLGSFRETKRPYLVSWISIAFLSCLVKAICHVAVLLHS
jgi:hypothetical protein